MIAVRQCFGPFLAGSIWLQRMAAIGIFRRGVRWIGAINAGGGREDIFLNIILTAQLKHIKAAGHIGIHEHPGILRTGAHARPGSQIDDTFKFGCLEVLQMDR